MRSILALALASSLATSSMAASLPCPLIPVADAEVGTLFVGHNVRTNATRSVVAYTSSLKHDDDGKPDAYHVGTTDDGPDAGEDHICVGGSVLELRNGKLIDKYAENGSVGSLTRKGGHALQCKRDYIDLRDAGFPPCGSGPLCMRWFGVASLPRPCGFDRPADQGCGTPVRQFNASGRDSDFYLTVNTLRRPGSARDTRRQADYADAGSVPFIVLPGRVRLPLGKSAGPGDYAAVVVGGKVAYAVVGDSGPSGKLGEGSHALHAVLGTHSIDAVDGSYTLLFPGTADYAGSAWPLTTNHIAERLRSKLRALFGGSDGDALASVRRCALARSR